MLLQRDITDLNINPKESDFDDSQTKVLNIWIYLIFSVMGIGFVLAMVKRYQLISILNHT